MSLKRLGCVWILWLALMTMPTGANDANSPFVIAHNPPQTPLQAEFWAAWQAALQAEAIPYVLQPPPTDPAVNHIDLSVTFNADGQSVWYIQRGAISQRSGLLWAMLAPHIHADVTLNARAMLGYVDYARGACPPEDEPFPSPQQAAFFAANCAILQDDYARAEAQLSALEAQLRADNVPLNSYMPLASHFAWLDVQRGETDAAARRFDPYLADARKPQQQAALLAARAQIYALGFQYDNAIANVSEALQLATDAALDAHTLAMLHKQRADHIFLIYEWDRVLQDYDRALTLSPTYAEAYYARGVLYYTQGPRPRALADFTRYLALSAPHAPERASAQRYIESIRAELAALEGGDIGGFGEAPSSGE